jgi:hypothetical protein
MSRVIALATLMALLAAPALAQGPCLPREIILRQLETQHGERPLWHGLGGDGRLLEIVAAPDGSSWTALVSLPPSAQHPDGLSCVVATGQAWRPPLPPTPRERET